MPPTENNPPAEPATVPPFSVAWWDLQIVAQKQVEQQRLGVLTATDAYQQYQRVLAVREHMQECRAVAAMMEGKGIAE